MATRGTYMRKAQLHTPSVEKGVMVCGIAFESRSGIGVRRHPRVAGLPGYDVDGAGQAVDAINACCRPADDFNALNGIRMYGQVETVMYCMGINHFDNND